VRFERACGILLHPTSLPGRFGIGDLGGEAERYVHWLAATGVTWWQVLPLNPPGPANSPYAATSTFAGSTLLLSPDLLGEDGLLDARELADLPELSPARVDFARAAALKTALLRRAWQRFSHRPDPALADALVLFRMRAAAWLADYALFAALLEHHGGCHWREWPRPLALHTPSALAEWRRAHQSEVHYHEFCQFLFDRQWARLRACARASGVQILGDLPIYVADNSADVWANRELFRLDQLGRPLGVAGVPPDYFSATGQRWGNPLYDWEALARTGYRWWIARLRRTLDLVDAVRIDHFRGFAAYWDVPAAESTAIAGRWVPGPGRSVFDALRDAIGEVPMIAEDLGFITPDVVALRDELGFPGMAVLQFAFDPLRRSEFLPHRLRRAQVVYTGTHDNNTTLGWYRDDASEAARDFARRYLSTDGREIHWDVIRAALASVCDLAVIPQQDIAGLGSEARMNTPSRVEANWAFRMTWEMAGDWHRARLGELIRLYGRGGELT
jgi:4-alpha-glucanotransferase